MRRAQNKPLPHFLKTMDGSEKMDEIVNRAKDQKL